MTGKKRPFAWTFELVLELIRDIGSGPEQLWAKWDPSIGNVFPIVRQGLEIAAAEIAKERARANELMRDMRDVYDERDKEKARADAAEKEVERLRRRIEAVTYREEVDEVASALGRRKSLRDSVGAAANELVNELAKVVAERDAVRAELAEARRQRDDKEQGR